MTHAISATAAESVDAYQTPVAKAVTERDLDQRFCLRLSLEGRVEDQTYDLRFFGPRCISPSGQPMMSRSQTW
jgi:hypothetical protein